jgi:hypothetical protein
LIITSLHLCLFPFPLSQEVSTNLCTVCLNHFVVFLPVHIIPNKYWCFFLYSFLANFIKRMMISIFIATSNHCICYMFDRNHDSDSLPTDKLPTVTTQSKQLNEL